MLPAPAMSANFRDINTDNPAASLDNILAQINKVTAINIPSNAGRAYQEFDLATSSEIICCNLVDF